MATESAPGPAAATAPLLDALRGLTAAGVLTSAAVHLHLYGAGFSGIATIGPLFLLNAIVGFVLGMSILVWPQWWSALLCAGFGAVTVAAYWWSVLFGLFGVREVTGGWSVILAEVAEYLAVVCGLALAAMQARGGARPPTRGRAVGRPAGVP